MEYISPRGFLKIDIALLNQDGQRKPTIQVKALQKNDAVPLGINPSHIADYYVICRYVISPTSEVFIIDSKTLKNMLAPSTMHKEQVSYWLVTKNYEPYKDNWAIIGDGF